MSSRKKTYLIVTLLVLAVTLNAYANPEGENTVAGSATFDRSTPNTLTVNTASNNTIINYNSFSIAANETTRFNQPSANSAVLNRVVGVDPSSIYGTLSSNGKLFLVNPNGILFGPGSQVNAPAIVASTLDIANDDFLKGNYNFFKNGENAFVINQGRLAASPGGYIALLSQAVNNQGVVIADLGTVALASGEKITLALDSLAQISVVVDDAVKSEVIGPDGQKIDSAIKNSGTIQANGGKVILTAKVLNDVFDYAVNNTGLIQAKSVVNHDGVVELVASGAPIINIGKIEAGTVNVTVTNAGFINKGQIITDGSLDLPNGGRIVIEAATVLQQGKITANAVENGTAGQVSIVSVFSTLLDEGSSTEAHAVGIVGNGGRILINSTGGNTVVNKNSTIDVSAGAISGNAGFIEISAYKQLGFFGILSGRAPPGYQHATVLFDPISLTGNISFWNVDYTVTSPDTLTVSANITVTNGNITLLAGTDFILNPTYLIQTVTTGNVSITGATVTLLGTVSSAGNVTITGRPVNSSNVNSIQTAINAISTVIGTTRINVAAGTYNESPSININKRISLLGPNVGINPNTGTRVAEAIITGQVTIASNGVTLDGFTVTNPNGTIGVYINGINNVLIQNDILNNIGINYTGSNGIQAVYIHWGSSDISNITVKNNQITNIGNANNTNSNKAIFVGDTSSPTVKISNVTIDNNNISGVFAKTTIKGAYGILVNHLAPGIQITNNNIANLDGWWAHAIGLEGDTLNAIVTGNTISNLVSHNIAVNDAVGVFFEANPSAGTVTVQNNSLATSVYWGVAIHPNLLAAYPGLTVNASDNWWGTNNPTDVAARVSPNVDYTPWLDSGTDISANPGFQGDFSVLNVSAASPQTGSTGIIQEGINLVTVGGTVNVAAGTYTLGSAITINKYGLKILGAQANVDPRPSVGGRTGNETILKSSGTVFDIQADNAEINGFTIESSINNSSLNIVQEVSESFSSKNAKVLYNIIYNTNYPTGAMNEAVKIRTGENAEVAYNYIYNIPYPGDGINFDRVTNGTIEYNELKNQGSTNAAIYVYKSTDTTIKGNLVYSVTNNDGIKLGDSGDGSTGGTVQDNIVHDVVEDGITIYASGVTVDNNTIYNCGSENGALYLYGADDTSVINNKIYNNNAIGLLIHNSDNVTVTGNEIYNNNDSDDSKYPGSAGIWLTSTATNITINNNSIHDNADYELKNENASVVDASGNWWGSDAPEDVTAAVSANIDYTPWLASGTDTSANPGFQGDFSVLNVSAASPQTGATGRIQEAIDTVIGSTVNVLAGTYTESILIDKPLNLIGRDGKPVITGASGNNYIIKISGTSGVVIDNVEVNGGGSAAGDNAFDYGIFIQNSPNAEVKNSIIKSIWKVSADAVSVQGSTNVNIHGNNISSFHKRGIRYFNSSGKIYNNVVTGDNVDGTNRVQDLVILWGGSNAEIYGNTLSNALTTPGVTPTWDSPAIFITSYDNNVASYANIHDNIIYNCDTGIIIGSVYATTDTSTATITNNTLYDLNWGITFEKATASAVISGNTFTHNNYDFYRAANVVGTNNYYGGIQQAIDAAVSGNTINVAAGTYAENVIINKSLTLAAASAPVLDGIGIGGVGMLINAPDVTIDGFEIKNYAIGIRTYGGPGSFGNLGILNSNIHNNTQNGILIVYDIFNNVTINNCTISNNSQNGIGIANGVQITNLGISNTQVTGNGYHGLFVTNANIGNINIINSAFNGSTTNGYSGITFGTAASTIGDFSMQGGSLSGNKGCGLSIVQAPSTFNSITLNGVTIQNNLESGIMLGGGARTGSLSILNSTFSGNAWEELDLSGGWFGAFAVTGSTNITNNVFAGGGPWAAIYIGNLASFGAAPVIYNNSFSGYGNAVFNVNATLVDASGNWWGTSTPTGVAAKAGSNVDYTPWLNSGTDTAPLTPGFQGDFSVLNVSAASPQTGSVGRIQEGINLVSTGGTVNIAAGNYSENINVNKWVSLIGTLNGTDLATFLTPAANSPIITLAASGNSSAEPILLKNLHITTSDTAGASDDGKMTGIRVVSPGVPLSHIKLDNISVIGNNHVYPGLESGVSISLDTSLSDLVIINSSFKYLSYGFISGAITSTNPGSLTNVNISNTTFDHNSVKGFYAERLSDATFTNVTVTNNGNTALCPSWAVTTNAGIDINLKYGAYQNLVFNNLTVTGNGIGSTYGAGLAVKARGTGNDPSYNSVPASLDGVTINGGTFTGNTTGIRFGEPGKNNTGPTNITVSNAAIYGNTQYGLSNELSGVTVIAENNYWGNAAGPTNAANPHGASVFGDVVSGNVDFMPWYATSTTTSSTQFVSVFDTPTSIYAYSDTIQGGIDAAVSGDTVNVAAGTYNERIWLDKAVNLFGADKATTIINGITNKDSVIAVVSLNTPITIKGFTIDANNYPSYAAGEWENGIYIYNSNYITVEQNNIINFKADGVLIGFNSNNNVVKGNTITGSLGGSNAGINVYANSGGNTIGGPNAGDGNTITLAASGIGNLYDIYFSGVNSKDNTVQNNTINGGARAIQIDGGNTGTTTISNNTIGNTLSPSFAGIYLNGGSAIISRNTLKDAVRPIEFWGAKDVTISGNTINGNGSAGFDGINAGSASGPILINNNNEIYNIGNNASAIHARSGAANIVIDGNEITTSRTGILIDNGCTGVQIKNNNIHDNTFSAIELHETVNTITGNTLSNNWRGIETWSPITAQNNSIVNHAYGGVILNSDGPNKVDQNWWGDTLSPAGKIVTNGHPVDYSPWWGDNYVGNAHATPWVWYTNDSIQDTINLASGTIRDTIEVISRGTSYNENLTISKPLTLTSLSTLTDNNPILQGGGLGTTGISISSDNVTISHLTIHGYDIGIDILGAYTSLAIENNYFNANVTYHVQTPDTFDGGLLYNIYHNSDAAKRNTYNDAGVNVNSSGNEVIENPTNFRVIWAHLVNAINNNPVDGDINVFHDGDFDLSSTPLDTHGGDLIIKNNGLLTLGSVNTHGGSIILNVNGDPDLVINGTVDSAGGDIDYIVTGYIQQTATGWILTHGGYYNATAGNYYEMLASSIIDTTGGPGIGTVTLRADIMNLNGAINAGSKDVTLRTNTVTVPINLGTKFITPPDPLTLGLTNTELNTITTSGQLIIGDSSHTGGVIISNNINPSLVTGGLKITTNSITNNDKIIDTGAGNITLISDTIDLGATANTIRTTGAVTLKPLTASTAIGIGTGATGAYNLTNQEIATIKDGASSITIGDRTNGTGDIDIHAVTFNDPLIVSTKSVTGGKITVGDTLTGAGNASITFNGSGSTTTLNADIVTAGTPITINDGVEIGNAAGVILNTTNGAPPGANIHITGTTNSTSGNVYSLTLNSGTSGTIALDGAVGITDKINTLTVTQSNGATFGDAVTVNTITITDTQTGQTVAFLGDLNATTGMTVAAGTSAYDVSLLSDCNITNDVNFLNTGVVTLGDFSDETLTFAGGLSTIAGPSSTHTFGTIQTNGAQIDIGSLILDGTTTIATNNTVPAGNNINFDTINGNNALTVNSGTSGITSFNGIVGAGTPLASITTDAGGTTRIGANMNTQGGTMTFNDPLTLTASAALTDTGGTGGTFNNTVNGPYNLTLAINGATNFNQAVGNTNPIGTGIGAALTINSSGATNFNSTLQTASGITQADTAGLVTFKDNVTVGAGDTASTLNANVTLDGLTFTAARAITFGNSTSDQLALSSAAVIIDTSAANKNITFNSKIDGSQALTVKAGTGTVTLGGAVGASTPINKLSVTATTIKLNGGSIKTGDVTGNNVALTGAVVLGANTTINTDNTINDGNITITGTTNADAAANARTLDLIAGTGAVSLTGTVGGSQPLRSFTVTSANTANLPAITTRTGGISVTASSITLNGNLTTTSAANAGPVSITGPVTLKNNITINTNHATGTDGNITITGTTNADAAANARTLDLIAGTGAVSLTGTVGGSQPLRSFTVTSANTANLPAITTRTGGISVTASSITLNGNLDTTSNLTGNAGPISITGPVTLGNDITINTDHTSNTDANVTFTGASSTINGAKTLTITSGTGTVTLGGAVGDIAPLLNLTVNTGNTLALAHNITATDTVTLNPTTGGVNQTAGSLTADKLLLTGAGTFTLNQSGNNVNTLAANITGALTYTDTDTLSVGSVSGTDGITTGGNDVTLNTGNTLTIANDINASSATVTLNPTTGGITESTGKILTANLLLTGAGTFNLTNANNDVDTLAADINGSLTYTDINTLTVGTILGTNGITANSGSVTLNTGGLLTVTDPVWAENNITLQAYGSSSDLNVDADVYSDLGDVYLYADNSVLLNSGTISSGNDYIDIGADYDDDGLGLINQTGGTIGSGNEDLFLYAAEGINLLSTNVSRLQAINTDTGNITITNNAPLELFDLNGWGYSVENDGGAVTILASSPITVSSDVISSSDITLQATDAGSNLDDLTVNANIHTGSGLINLKAGHDIIQNSHTISTGGDVYLQADYDGSGEGAITQNGGNITASGLRFDAAGAVTLNQTGNNVDNLAGQTTAAGNIQFKDADHLAVTHVLGLDGITANLGSITIKALNGFLTISKAITATGSSIILGTAEAAVTPADLTLGANLNASTVVELNSADAIIRTAGMITADSLDLIADSGIGTFANPLHSQVNSLNALNNTSGDISLTNDGNLNAVSVINNNINGNIYLIVNSNLTVGDIEGLTVNLTANTGGILDDGVESTQIVADTVNLKALAGNIGSTTDDLDIDAATINAQASGDIYIEAINGTLFNNISGNNINLVANGSTYLNTITGADAVNIGINSGDLTFQGTVTSNGTGPNRVNIIVYNGSIFATGGAPNIIAYGDTFLSVPKGVITVIGSPLNVSINNGAFLILDIGAKVGLVSGRLIGTIADYNHILFLNASFPSPQRPPGLVYFNGVIVWPSATAFANAQTNNALLGRYTIPVNFAPFLVNTADTRLSLFYHPLTESDMSAFDSLSIGEDAYNFIDDSLNFKGHEGLLPILEDIKKKKKKGAQT